jgi:hypothetical protein
MSDMEKRKSELEVVPRAYNYKELLNAHKEKERSHTTNSSNPKLFLSDAIPTPVTQKQVPSQVNRPQSPEIREQSGNALIKMQSKTPPMTKANSAPSDMVSIAVFRLEM